MARYYSLFTTLQQETQDRYILGVPYHIDDALVAIHGYAIWSDNYGYMYADVCTTCKPEARECNESVIISAHNVLIAAYRLNYLAIIASNTHIISRRKDNVLYLIRPAKTNTSLC